MTSPNSPARQVEVDSLIHHIYSTLVSGGWGGKCAACRNQCRSVRDVAIDHDEFLFIVPLCLCNRCARSPLFRSRADGDSGLAPAIGVAVAFLFLISQMWILAGISLAMAAGLFFWESRDPQESEEKKHASLRKLLSSTRPYPQLLEEFGDVTLQLPSLVRGRDLDHSSEAELFLRRILIRRQQSLLANEDEMQKSYLPAVILESYFEMVDRRVKQVFCNEKSAIVQVGGVLLPNRQLQFDIAMAAEAATSSLREQLKQELESVPAWPVAYPVVFVLRRIFGSPDSRLESRVSPPFARWSVLLDGDEGDSETTYAELAIRVYKLKPATDQIEIELEDCDAIRRCLPDSVPLQFFHARLLRTQEQYETALSMYDKLLEEHRELEEGVDQERVACYAEVGQFERAATLCQRQLSRNPDNSTFLAFLAQLQLNLNQPAEALSTIDRVVSDRNTSSILHMRAVILVELERWDEARSALNLAIFQDLNFAPAYFLRASLFLQNRRAEEALADLSQFHRCASPTFDSLQLKAGALVALGRALEAEQSYRELTEEYPDNLALRLQMAEFLAQTGKLESAKEECEAVIKLAERFAPAFAVRAAICLEMSHFESAISDADKAIDLGTDGPQVWLIRGLARAALGQVEQAFEDLDTCVEIAPEFALPRLHRGRLRFMQEEFESAVAEFTSALEIAPQWTDPLIERGYAFLGLEQPEQARRDFAKAIELSPELANAYTGRAICHLILGKKVEAAEDLDKAVALDPSDVSGRMNRVMLLLQKHEPDLAREDLDEILAVEPDCGAALMQRAHIHLNLGRFQDAKKDFDRLIEINPDAPEAFVGRSIASEQAGDASQAEADRERAKELAPFSAEELEVSRSLLGAGVANRNEQFAKAIELATQVIDEHPEPVWDAHRIRGQALWYSENFVEALEDYSEIIEHSEEATRHDYSAYGQILAELGEFEQALESLDRSIQIGEEEQDLTGLAFSLNGKGRALAGLGRIEEAEECFSKSIQLKPDNAWLHFNRGLMYAETKQLAQALACFELALNMNSPKLSPAKRLRGRFDQFDAEANRHRPPGVLVSSRHHSLTFWGEHVHEIFLARFGSLFSLVLSGFDRLRFRRESRVLNNARGVDRYLYE